MKTTTVRKVIAKKMDEWLETVTDEQLRKDLRAGLLVSGGSIASMLLGEPVNDYDVYLSDMDLVKRVALYYTKPFEDIHVLDGRIKADEIAKYAGKDLNGDDYTETTMSKEHGLAVSLRTLRPDQIKLLMDGGGGYAVETREETAENKEERPKYRPVYFSPNAISLSDDVQIVLRFYGDHTEVHKTFDFVHATNYFTFKDGLVTNVKALESLLTKTLLYQGSLYPLTSIIRAKKFIKRNFRISAGEYLKIMFQISQLDLTDIDVLEEQLIGVDVAYFATLIRILREVQEKDPDFDLTPNYMNAIIDRVFNGDEGEE